MRGKSNIKDVSIVNFGKEKINKRGAAHFEMIISFVFFIGFVFFLFIALKPYDTTTLSGAVVSGLYFSFEEATHTNLSDTFFSLLSKFDCKTYSILSA